MVDELSLVQPDLLVVPLKEPMVGVACNDSTFEAHAFVDLTLNLQTAAGPVKTPGNRLCYVVHSGDEFLASDDTLKAVAIDINRLLEQVATLQLDNGDDLGEDGDALKELSHCSTVRANSAMLGLPDAKDAVEHFLQELVEEAVGNGFPNEFVQHLWRVLTKHDTWRAKFDGSDPPARVKPLKVTPKEGVPYRCKGRKHNLLEDRFHNLFARVMRRGGDPEQPAECVVLPSQPGHETRRKEET
ncbi:hypothetical protein H310_03908 [Aphanomyces invadans]|uniref:Uncharacterized protein n=1 Tax=Aphanomyces invadans TaxID=157072 RepID=A0A024UEW3_9STRA|nr:hypothetical protein H310_03908 [Aphanomyces invadans]ETW04760.1 hypothetical protein H310_03908 [Aphanomyces invadans]RHY26395.1 hypothetical protein DYB32_007648 [Aphanomyces invadans]|eukprot:XP_008866198.1 hypothetical protein H310_03908 [Aphanomyces invadans]